MKEYLNLFRIGLVLLTITQPLFSQAQGSGVDDASDLINQLGNLINSAIPVVTGMAVLGFFWGLTKYIYKAGDKEAKKEGQRIMIAGIIGIFLITAIGGIIELLAESFGVGTGTTIPIPGVGTGNG